MPTFYAGIGSRETPEHILHRMREIAEKLDGLGLVLRSGNADGADKAFQSGSSNMQVMLPWDGYNGALADCHTYFLGATREAEAFTAPYHPAWDRCSQGARKLHARNATILGGLLLDEPVSFVVCWTKDGKDTGGTGQALRMTETNQIPVFNLFHDDAEDRLNNHLYELLGETVC